MPPPPEEVAGEKSALRVIQRALLAQLGAGERRARSAKLLARLLELPVWRSARRVVLFAPLATEPDLDLLWTNGGLAGKEAFYPRVVATRLQLLPVRGLADLVPAQWGLREPSPPVGLAEARLDEVDLVLVPGLAFDVTGGRLGRGGGFYDRLLTDKRGGTRAFGVAFAFQIVAKVPLASDDVMMDALVTDEEIVAAQRLPKSR